MSSCPCAILTLPSLPKSYHTRYFPWLPNISNWISWLRDFSRRNQARCMTDPSCPQVSVERVSVYNIQLLGPEVGYPSVFSQGFPMGFPVSIQSPPLTWELISTTSLFMSSLPCLCLLLLPNKLLALESLFWGLLQGEPKSFGIRPVINICYIKEQKVASKHGK